MVADLSLDKETLNCDEKKRLELAGLSAEVAFVQAERGLSERRACKLLEMERSSYRYEPRPDRNVALRGELVKLADRSPATAMADCMRY